MSRTTPWRPRSPASDAPSDPPSDVDTDTGTETDIGPGRDRPWSARGPVPLVRAAHPLQALLTAAGLALVAALSGRPLREVGLVFATVLLGQVVLGWHNDLVDRVRDRRHDLPGKPVAQGFLDPGNTWFALLCGVLALVPLAVSTGVTAGCFYLLSVAVGVLGNVVLRTGALSWLPWAVSFALYPCYLSYGGWGGAAVGDPPQPVVVVLFALLGIGVHFLRALGGLVPDHEDGWTTLPLRAALRIGAARLLAATAVYLTLVVAALAAAGTWVGLRV